MRYFLLLSTSLLALAATVALARGDDSGPLPVSVFTVQETVATPAATNFTIPPPSTIQSNLVSAINATGRYHASVGATFPPEGLVLVPRLAVGGAADFHSAILSLTVIRMPQFSSPFTKAFDVKNAIVSNDPTIPYVSALELNNLFAGPATPPLIPADVVFINDGLPDSKTASTTFSGPAYYEARLHQDLAIHRLLGIGIGQYLNSPGNTGALAVFSSNDEAFAAACAKNPSLIAIRYSLDYEETKNPFWGTQNGTATTVARMQRCGTPPTAQYPVVANAHNFGSGALLTPQYFQLANWLLLSGRKNPNYRGFLGTEGGIAASLLPVAPDTAAEARAVGETAAKSACLVSYFYYDPLNYVTLTPSQLGTRPPKNDGVCSILREREQVIRIQAQSVPTPVPSATP